ncbi:MAG: hypothetical protein MJ182_06085 [Treponema sp.]|nr:hypothetical protein [Treponema sp.]
MLAFVFALVFAAIGYGVVFVFKRFLADDSIESQDNSNLGNTVGKTSAKRGQTVDLVIQDEDLPSDEVTGQYIVNDSQRIFTAGDIKNIPTSSPAAAQNAYAKQQQKTVEDSGAGSTDFEKSSESEVSEEKFVPVRNLETLYNVSGKEAVTKTEDKVSKAGTFSLSGEEVYSAEDEELDTLPSMDSLGDSIGGGDSSRPSFGDDEVNNETEFATAGSSGGSRRSAEPDENVIKDAPLLAKAISTILANES